VSTEAALFAMRYGQQDRLVGFYAKTVDQSPRDSRWMIVLARVETTLERYPEAIIAYSKAIVVRPDRVDLYTARAGLDEKLERYDEAASDYEELYQLTYKDPSWLQKAAETRLRQGKPDLAVAALKSALIGQKNPKAAGYFAAARQLELWNLLQPARELAEKGVALASDDLLADYANQSGAVTYVRILTRLREPDVALARMKEALAAADRLPSLAATVEHVEEAGVGSVTESEWRERQREVRMSIALSGFTAALREMTATAKAYDAPEETQAFVELLRANAAKASDDDLQHIYLPAVESSSFPTLEADWKWRLAASGAIVYQGAWNSWVELQRERLLQASAGKQLESFAATASRNVTPGLYAAAAQLYRDSGDAPAELRALERSAAMNELHSERYLDLLLAQNPQQLPQLAQTGPAEARDTVTQYAILHASPALALQVVNARGNGLPPVWTRGYTALTGDFMRQENETTDGAFRATLGDGSITQRLAAPVDRNQQLAGDLWFYYGARYGEYLSLGNSPVAEDYLPATLEQQPESASAYIDLAEWYAEQDKLPQAIAEYDYALQLIHNSPTIYDSQAMLLLRLGKKQEANKAWQQAVALLLKQIDLKRVPDSFWPDFTRIVGQHGARFQYSSARPQIDAMLRVYIKRNGSYMTEPLLRAIFQADGDANDAVSWILDLSAAGNSPDSVLENVVDTSWLPAPQKPRLYARMVELARDSANQAEGQAKSEAQNRLRHIQAQWIEALIKVENFAEARRELDAIPIENKKSQEPWLSPELKIAAHDGSLASMVEAWKRDALSAPTSDVLRNAAAGLDATAKSTVLAFIYASALDAHDLSATNFLGLAEIGIANGDMPGAIALLNRMVLVSQDPPTDLGSAASLLTRGGHYAEALPFLKKLTSTVPWDASCRVRLDEAKLKAGQETDSALNDLAALAADPAAIYAVRTQAAQLLSGRKRAGNFGSAELNLLARGSISASEAQKPYFMAARITAAQSAPLPQRVLLLKQVIADAPHDDNARILLLHAAIDANDAHLVINAANPLLPENVLAAVLPYDDLSSGEGEEAFHEEALNDEISGDSESFKGLSYSERVALLSATATAYLRIGEPAPALALFLQASRIEPDAARRKAISAQAAHLRQEIVRGQANAARAPQIHSTLDQNHPVRPRLLVAQKESEQ
jgi:cellulose synthase operon protein C